MINLQEKISSLVEQGYELRFPGGKNRRELWQESYASFGVIPQKKVSGKDSQIEILFVPYKKKAFQVKHNFSEKVFIETPPMTLEREVLEETNVRLLEYCFLTSFSVDDNEEQGEVHTKYAYITNQYDAANVRRGLSPSQPNLGVPLWVPLMLIKKYPIFLFSGHQWILKEAEQYLGYFPNKIPKVSHKQNHF